MDEWILASLTDEDPGLINQCHFNDWINERGGLTKIVDCTFHSLISKNGLYFNRKSSDHMESLSSFFVGEAFSLTSSEKLIENTEMISENVFETAGTSCQKARFYGTLLSGHAR